MWRWRWLLLVAASCGTRPAAPMRPAPAASATAPPRGPAAVQARCFAAARPTFAPPVPALPIEDESLVSQLQRMPCEELCDARNPWASRGRPPLGAPADATKSPRSREPCIEASFGSAVLDIEVVEEDGHPVPHARVLVRGRDGCPLYRLDKADSEGELRLHAIPEGQYVVEAASRFLVRRSTQAVTTGMNSIEVVFPEDTREAEAMMIRRSADCRCQDVGRFGPRRGDDYWKDFPTLP